MNKNYAEALDEILKFINSQETKMIIRRAMVYDPFLDMLTKKGINIHANELPRMFEFLEEDGMMQTTQAGEPVQMITLKGMDWISPEIGGYTRQRQNAIDDRVYVRNFDKTVKKNASRLTWGTWGLVAATLGLVAWEMYKTFCIENGCH